MLKTYEDLVNACLGSGFNFHLLYVYMQLSKSLPEPEMQRLFPDVDVSGVQTVGTIVFDAHESVKPGLTFSAMVEKADGFYPHWDVVFVLTSRNADNSPVSEERARANLADMREKIMNGEFPQGAPIFDKAGRLKGIDLAMPVRVQRGGERAN